MKRILSLMKVLLLPLCLLPAWGRAAAQEPDYLLPAFGQGTVYFDNQGPAEGQMNIAAADHSLRFLDADGQERIAADISHVTRVIIDGIPFIRDNGFFYRMYPVNLVAGVALKREIRVLDDGKHGAFGTVDRTSSIRDYKSVYGVDGSSYLLNQDRKAPVSVVETLFLYNGDEVIPVNKRNLRKCFPGKKAEIDRFFSEGGQLPEEAGPLREFLRGL